MSVSVLLVGTLLLIAGTGFAFMGYRGFLSFLPVWGAVAGAVAGAGVVAAVTGEPFLGGIAGWIGAAVGGVAGGAVAVISWWGPIGIGAGSVGWIAGAGAASLLGGGAGLLVVLVAAAGAVLVAALANVTETPRPLVVVLSAVGGASAMAAGVALLLAWAPLERLAWHALGVVFGGGTAPTVTFVTIAAIAAAFQLTTTRSLEDDVSTEIARRRG